MNSNYRFRENYILTQFIIYNFYLMKTKETVIDFDF